MKRFCNFIVLICLLLVSCSQKTISFENEMLNLENGIDFIKVGNETYSSKLTDSYEFVIVKNNNQNEEELLKTENFATSFNYSDGKLFFLDGRKIYSYDLNSDRAKMIAEAHSSFAKSILVKENFVYYIDGSDLTKLAVDTGARDILANDAVLSFDVSGNIIYYQAISEEGKGLLKKIDLSDNGKTDIVYQGAATYISIESDGVYFLNHNLVLPFDKGDNKIYKIANGDVAVPICEERAKSYNIADGKIYYTNMDDGGKLYQMNKNGTGQEMVYDKEVFNVIIFDKEVFCRMRDGEIITLE